MKFRQSLFWDVDPNTINIKKNARYIIERILEFGNDTEIRWMWRTYSKKLLKETLHNSRGVLHAKTKALWSLMLR